MATATASQPQPSRRAAAAQATVDRYAAAPVAKRIRSLVLASEHGLTHAADALALTRDRYGLLVAAAYLVPSRSGGQPHLVLYHPDTDSASCDCPAGVAGLPCGHQGAGIIAGRIADRFIAIPLADGVTSIIGAPVGPAVTL